MLYLRAGGIATRGFWSSCCLGCRRTKLRPTHPSTADRASILRVGEDEWQSRFCSPRLAQVNSIKIEKPNRHTSPQGTGLAMNRAIQATHSNVGYRKHPRKDLGQHSKSAVILRPLTLFGSPNSCKVAKPDFLRNLNRQSRVLESAV